MLTTELADALGLDGTPGLVFGNFVGSALQQVVNNAISGTPLLTGLDGVKSIFGSGPGGAGPGSLAVNAIATFLGNRLGSLVVSPQTQAGVILSNLGSAAGAYAFSAAGFGWGASLFGIANPGFWAANVLFPGVGAFVGFVVGALIGNLFGKKKPKPTASADTVLNFSNGYYQLGTVTVNGGNRALVESMALQARDILNGLIQVVSGEVEKAPVLNSTSPTQQYGHTLNTIWAKFNGGAQQNFADAAAAVEWGTMQAIRVTQIAGGDMLAKRVLAYSPSTTLTALAGDLQIASDYGKYLRNRAKINSEILAPWNSLSASDKSFFTANQTVMTRILAKNEVTISGSDLTFYNSNKATADRIIAALTTSEFAAGWMITLQRAAELKLDEWKPSDFYGGFKGLMDSFGLAEKGIGYEQLSFNWSWMLLGIALPGTVPADVFSVAPSANADGRSFNIAGFGPGLGYNFSSWDAGQGRWATSTGNDFLLETTATSVTYDDLYNGVSGGDDLFLAGGGHDTLRGREGFDWLSGGGGNDLIEGGNGNDVLIGGAGNDRLYGDNGDDYLAGGEGWDHPGEFTDGGLHGGGGNDTLVQHASSTSAGWGDDGDDLFIMATDGGAHDFVDGGAGNDTISFERETAGVTVNLATPHSGGGIWRNILGDQVGNIENITGSRQNDSITGDGIANVLRGLDGDDVLNGSDGNDTLEGGGGKDTLNGGNGTDTLSFAKSSTGVVVDMFAGTASGGDAAGDSWTAMENLIGSLFDDVLTGDGTTNYIQGLRGNDWLRGSNGADTMDGGEGFDTVDFSHYAFFGVAIALDGTASSTGHTYISIEHLVGTAFADTFSGSSTDEAFTGGAGNDTMMGGNGADQYFVAKGDGSDVIYDNVGGNNGLFLSGVTWSDLWLGTPSGELQVGVRGTSDQVRVMSNFQGTHPAPSNIIKSLGLRGGGTLELGGVTWAVTGSDNAENLFGQTNVTDLVFGYNGNDVLYGSATGQAESNGNIFVGGLGNDTIRASVGDDQFAFDRGDGADTIYDTGGDDTMVIGGGTRAEDVIFHIDVANGDLYIGLRDLSTPDLNAMQVADRVRIVGGAYQYSNGTTSTIEYVQVAGTSIDLRNVGLTYVPAPYTGPGPIPPIVFDLAGDGLDLSTVEDSDIVTRTDSGALIRMGWVGPTDGILALDRDGDGQINRLSEISFVKDLAGAKTDLEGLAAFDDNKDGVLDANDKRFGEFRLWVDANQNGRSTAKELRTLAEAGIAAINLKGTLTGLSALNTLESHAVATTSFTRKDGSTGSAYDVQLARQFINQLGFADGKVPEKYRNAGSEDAVIGRLEADPRLSVLSSRSGLVGNVVEGLDALRDALSRGQVLDYETVAGRAIADFTDHDRLSAKDALKWADQLAGRKKLNLADGVWDSVSQKQLEKVRAVSADGTMTARASSTPLGAPYLPDDSRADPVFASDASDLTSAWDNDGGDGGSAKLADLAPVGAPVAERADGWGGGTGAYVTPWYLLDGGDALTGGQVASFGIGLGTLETTGHQAAQGPTPAAAPLPASADADQQRLVQALAAFRGASGMAAVRGPDARSIHGDALAAPALLDRLPAARHLAA